LYMHLLQVLSIPSAKLCIFPFSLPTAIFDIAIKKIKKIKNLFS